ncbi:ATP-binding protein [Streptomyces fuscichromogenes]|uniref:IstB-like ATP-binding domain-containing protein n=1 Tax=Streptomyces fuscichromogenes TaxID=1324013 RepID=A0A917XGC1_9ACTN|nr:hypothetical protein GCM10011578_053710 [Streptomyces fuscichromogenes]
MRSAPGQDSCGFRGPGVLVVDEVLATAILDRLLHHCEVVPVSGSGCLLTNRLAAIGGDADVA